MWPSTLPASTCSNHFVGVYAGFRRPQAKTSFTIFISVMITVTPGHRYGQATYRSFTFRQASAKCRDNSVRHDSAPSRSEPAPTIHQMSASTEI